MKLEAVDIRGRQVAVWPSALSVIPDHWLSRDRGWHSKDQIAGGVERTEEVRLHRDKGGGGEVTTLDRVAPHNELLAGPRRCC